MFEPRVSQSMIFRKTQEFARNGLINSGALVQFDPITLNVSVVEPSAAAHLGPEYPFAAEAPRLHGDYTEVQARDAWLEWLGALVGLECFSIRQLIPPNVKRRKKRVDAGRRRLALDIKYRLNYVRDELLFGRTPEDIWDKLHRRRYYASRVNDSSGFVRALA